MRTYRHSSGVQSVAYGPDGTLFALTDRAGELWAYPAGGADRVLAARSTRERPLEGWLDVSPDGRWLAVSGLYTPTLFRVGALAPAGDVPPAADRCSLLPGWEDHRFHPDLAFSARTCFTGDSAFWISRAYAASHSTAARLNCWRLTDLERFEHTGFPQTERQYLAAVPGTSYVVIEGWSKEHTACAFWRGDPARPDVPTVLVGTAEQCTGFLIGTDGRFFVSNQGAVLIYSLGPSGLHLDLTVPLRGGTVYPELSLSADARRFLVRSFESKLVCAVETGSGEVLGPWDWGIGRVNDVAIAPDGLTAAAAGSSKKLVVWDLDR